MAFHLRRPLEEAPQILALPPSEFPEFQKSNLLHFHPTIRFDPPQQVRTAPRSQMMAASCVPKESKHVAHAIILTHETSAKTLIYWRARIPFLPRLFCLMTENEARQIAEDHYYAA